MVDKNIGDFRTIIDNARKVPSLINTQPIADPYLQFTDYNSVGNRETEDEHANGYFIWGLHDWGNSNSVVT